MTVLRGVLSKYAVGRTSVPNNSRTCGIPLIRTSQPRLLRFRMTVIVIDCAIRHRPFKTGPRLVSCIREPDTQDKHVSCQDVEHKMLGA